MAKTKKPKGKRRKTKKELTASECIGNLLSAHMLQGIWLRRLKEIIELEKPSEVDNGVSTSAFSLAEASDSPELQR